MGRNEDYYERIEGGIREAGYEAPSKSTDKRQKEIWKYIREKKLSIRLEKNFDYNNGMHDPGSEYYEYAQMRSGDLRGQDVESRAKYWRERFYSDDPDVLVNQQVVTYGWRMSDGRVVFSTGNARNNGHKLAAIDGKDTSKFPVIIIGEDLSDDEKIDHMMHIAERSNYDKGDETEPETKNDIVNQLNLFERRGVETGRLAQNRSDEDRKAWAYDWLHDRKPTYRGETMKSVRTDIVNAFLGASAGRFGAVSAPGSTAINNIFGQYFQDYNWDPENEDVEVVQAVVNGEVQPFEAFMFRRFRNGLVGEELHAVALVGGIKGPSITSLSSLEKKREALIESMVEWNTASYIRKAGLAKVTCILFPKQLNTTQDEHEMWQWNSTGAKKFTKMQKVVKC